MGHPFSSQRCPVFYLLISRFLVALLFSTWRSSMLHKQVAKIRVAISGNIFSKRNIPSTIILYPHEAGEIFA